MSNFYCIYCAAIWSYSSSLLSISYYLTFDIIVLNSATPLWGVDPIIIWLNMKSMIRPIQLFKTGSANPCPKERVVLSAVIYLCIKNATKHYFHYLFCRFFL